MERPNRPYKGMQAELEERERRYAATAPTLPTGKDSVIEAATICLIIGTCTAIIGIGFPFLIATFVLGVYAMATHRITQGVIFSLSGVILIFVCSFFAELIWMNLLLNKIAAFNPAFARPQFLPR